MKIKQLCTIFILMALIVGLMPCYALAAEKSTDEKVTNVISTVNETVDRARETKERVSVPETTGLTSKGISQSEITVAWNEVAGASGYKLYRLDTSKDKYTLLADIKGGASCSYTDGQLARNTSESYKVKAYRVVDRWTYYGALSDKTTAATKPKTMWVTASAYHMGTTTASGTHVHKGVMAVDPRVIKMGTRVYVPGYGMARAEDTGGAIKGSRIDLYMNSTGAALKWGIRKVKITVYD